jgi:hypothetical protein
LKPAISLRQKSLRARLALYRAGKPYLKAP